MNKDRYRKRVIVSCSFFLFSFLYGFIFLNVKWINYTILGFTPITVLIVYEVLKNILKPWIGKYPHMPSYMQGIGSKIEGNGYPKNRKVTKADFAFGFLFLILPGLIIMFLYKAFIN